MLSSLIALASMNSQQQWTVSTFGQRSMPHFASAPYPHSSRENGFKNSTATFPRDIHYSDSTVGIFIPKSAKLRSKVNFVVHFHGHNNNVSQVFDQFKLEEEMSKSGLNAVLVVPQGPTNAPDSGDGKLELEPHGLEDMLKETLVFLQKSGFTPANPQIGKVALTAHSGGYKVTSAILAKKELPQNISDVILFDATYGGLAPIADWCKAGRNHRLISICTDHLGHENGQLAAMLQKRGVEPKFYLDTEFTEDLAAKRGVSILLTTSLEHNDVVSKTSNFSKWLKSAFR